MITPITPKEASASKMDFPDSVIESFNELIKKNMRTTISEVNQEEVVGLILLKDPTLTRNQIYKNNLLDVEDYYRSAGWKVTFHKAHYSETTPSYFTFSTI